MQHKKRVNRLHIPDSEKPAPALPSASHPPPPALFFTDLLIDHIGVAVVSLAEALPFYRDALGMAVEGIEEVPDQGVRIAFLRAGESHIELLEPLSPDGPVAKFLARRGPGLHHVALAVRDIGSMLRELEARGIALIDTHPRRGGGGKLIAFLHPRSTGGVLLELCQPLRKD